jgi:lysophospholipase L1-like esterase
VTEGDLMTFLWFGKKKKDEKTMKDFNEWTAKVYDDAYKYYSKMAKDENEDVFKLFDDWWNGKCVTTEEYKAKYSEKDRREAGGIILDAISKGLG